MSTGAKSQVASLFGCPSRSAYHGLLPHEGRPRTADPATGLERGRINITMRATGICQMFLQVAASQGR